MEKGPTFIDCALIHHHPAQLWSGREHSCKATAEPSPPPPPHSTGSQGPCGQEGLPGGRMALGLSGLD